MVSLPARTSLLRSSNRGLMAVARMRACALLRPNPGALSMLAPRLGSLFHSAYKSLELLNLSPLHLQKRIKRFLFGGPGTDVGLRGPLI